MTKAKICRVRSSDQPEKWVECHGRGCGGRKRGQLGFEEEGSLGSGKSPRSLKERNPGSNMLQEGRQAERMLSSLLCVPACHL